MSGDLIRNVRGRTVDTQYSNGLALHSTPMNYDFEIGFLLLWLALFYHTNECWLMVETWLAASRMSSKSPSNCTYGFIDTNTKFLFYQPRKYKPICYLSKRYFDMYFAFFSSPTHWSYGLLFFLGIFSLLNWNLQAEAMHLIGEQNVLEWRHFSLPLKALEGSQAHPCRKVLLLFPLAHHSSVKGCGLCDWPKQVYIDPAHPTPESLVSCSLTLPEESP